MQFLRLIFVKKPRLQGASPLDPTGGLLRPPGAHFSADFSILIPMPAEVTGVARPGRSPTGNVGFKPGSATLESDALQVSHRGGGELRYFSVS